MKTRFLLFALSAFGIAACSGNVNEDEEVVLAEGTTTCPITRGADVCTFFETSKPPVSDDIAIALQHTSVLAMRSHAILERAGTACANIVRDLGSGLPAGVSNAKDACQRAALALRANLATSSLRITITQGTCPTDSSPATTCAEARDFKLPACTPATMEITGGNNDIDLVVRQTIEANLLTLANALQESFQIRSTLIRLSNKDIVLFQGVESRSRRDLSCTEPLSKLINEVSADTHVVVSGGGNVLAVSRREAISAP